MWIASVCNSLDTWDSFSGFLLRISETTEHLGYLGFTTEWYFFLPRSK